MDWRADLRALIERVSEGDLADFRGELARLDALALQRQLQATNGRPQATELLDADQVARRLGGGINRKWVYRHADELGAVRLTQKKVRFPSAEVDAYLRRRKGASSSHRRK